MDEPRMNYGSLYKQIEAYLEFRVLSWDDKFWQFLIVAS